jgi:hypothetical protein
MRGTQIEGFWPAARGRGLAFAGEVNRSEDPIDNDVLELIGALAKLERGEPARLLWNPIAADD